MKKILFLAITLIVVAIALFFSFHALDECKTFKDKTKRGQCYGQKAIEQDSIDVCYSFFDHFEVRNQCIFTYAVKVMDEEKCELLAKQDWKDNCYFYVVYYQDMYNKPHYKETCEKIVGEMKRKECIQFVS